MFFDWLYSQPESVTRLIDRGFADLLAPSAIEWGERNGHPFVLDRQYDIEFWHTVKERSDAELARLRQQYTWLGDVFLRLLDEDDPVCFVRRIHDREGENRLLRTRAMADALLDRRSNATALLLHPDELVSTGRRIEVYHPEFVTDWIGDGEIYENAFSISGTGD